MAKQTTILFSTDARIQKNEQFKSYVDENKTDYSILFIDNELHVVIKDVKEDKQTADKVRMTAGAIARDLSSRKVEVSVINVDELAKAYQTLSKEEIVTAFVEGWDLGNYQFLTYKSEDTAFFTAITFTGEDVDMFVDAGKRRAEAMAFSRNLMNEVSNVLNPETFPSVLQEEFAETDVDVTVFNKDKLEEMEMNGLLSVCRGSKYDPAFVELAYKGDPSKPLVALVGKGVTFDTGGISLKSGRDLSSMRMDMGGAAAVAGAMKLLASSKAKVNVVALIQIVENMPGKDALLPGEVITFKNGKTVQVGNTDAEGRLILADGLIRAGELEADYIVNIATLTGAIAGALGSKLGGVFGDEDLMSEMKAIGDENGDFVWPMPLVDAYDSYLNSDYADFSNISNKGEAGSITAGLFLRRFVPESAKWLHVDMAGVMGTKESGYYSNAGTGFGARLLADYTEHVSK